MSSNIFSYMIVIVIFLILLAIYGLVISLVITIIFTIGLYKFTSYGNTTGLVKVCLKIYYSGRLSRLNHEEALIFVINKRVRSNHERQRVVATFRLLSQNNFNNIESDLCNLSYAFFIVGAGAPLDNWKLQNIFKNKFNKVYQKESYKFERFSEENC